MFKIFWWLVIPASIVAFAVFNYIRCRIQRKYDKRVKTILE